MIGPSTRGIGQTSLPPAVASKLTPRKCDKNAPTVASRQGRWVIVLAVIRTNVYVDGFNLYYRCLKGTTFKWLDIDLLAKKLLPGQHINRIRYFTARVAVRNDPGQQQRQQVYLRALATLPNVSIHYGQFLTNTVRMALANPIPGGPRFADVLKTEEKGSDVSLATHLLADGFDNDYEMAVVVSNDSDLQEPIHVVRLRLGRKVGVVITNPDAKRSALSADFYRRIRRGVLASSQFASQIPDAHGTIHRPPSW